MSYRERGYEPAPYRGEHMMNDPTTANARVYVGNLPVADISKKDLEDRFRKHGSVLGVTLNNRGFGFVQYEDEESALDAIKLENGANFKGKKIEVNQARVIGRVPGGPRRDDDRDRDRDRDRDFRDRSPMDDRDRDWRGDRSRDLHDRWSLRRDSSPAR
uniref:RRM domain-containing protein n=1 Tax=Timema bartmani TaxID=61472 RepID=A0A7R9I6U4_9NEOP|nr:unnamed protein product [Timema bartmani]